MSCLYCSKSVKQFSRLEPVQDLNQTPEFPIHDIIQNPQNSYREIYECNNCHHFWWIRVKGTGDPRSTYPEYYEQTAELIDDERAELLRNPTVSLVLKHANSAFPYTFFPEILEILQTKEQNSLRSLFLERESNLPNTAKQWLRTWFQKQFSKEYEEIQEKGFPSLAKSILQLDEKEKVIITEWIAIHQFVILSLLDDTYFLSCIQIPENKVLWKHSVKRPFLEGLPIPILFFHSGLICYYQGNQKGSEYFSQLNRPDELVLFDLNGNHLLSIPLAYRCYEILSTEERDVSENRVVQNFQFSILSNTLYIPHANEIHIYNLKSKELKEKLKTPMGDPFSGKALETESGVILFFTLKGVFAINAERKILLSYNSKYHPVMIDHHFNFYYYYSIIENMQTGEKIRFFQDKESGIEIPYTLASRPVCFPGGVLIPFAWDKSYLVNEKFQILKEFEFTSSDTLSPHSFGSTKSPILVTDDRIVIANEYRSIVMIDFLGNILCKLAIESEVLNVFSFDGKHALVILSAFDAYTEENQVEMILIAPTGEVIFKRILSCENSHSVSFEGILIFSNGFQLYTLDLFSGNA